MKPEKFREAAAVFRKIAEEHPEARVDMDEVDMPDISCSSPACFAGWWVFAHGEEIIPSGASDAWLKGARSIALFLGFDSRNSFETWAEESPDLWGNEDGDGVFCDPWAFGASSITLIDIATHLEGVADRIEGSEK
jgi:hypothetical protein